MHFLNVHGFDDPETRYFIVPSTVLRGANPEWILYWLFHPLPLSRRIILQQNSSPRHFPHICHRDRHSRHVSVSRVTDRLRLPSLTVCLPLFPPPSVVQPGTQMGILWVLQSIVGYRQKPGYYHYRWPLQLIYTSAAGWPTAVNWARLAHCYCSYSFQFEVFQKYNGLTKWIRWLS